MGVVVVSIETQFQVIVEFSVIVNVMDVSDPLTGTDPVPVHPVQIQISPASLRGLEILKTKDLLNCKFRLRELDFHGQKLLSS